MENRIKAELASMMNRIYAKGLTTTTGGNISVRSEEGIIFITPSGIDKSSLDANDIAVVKNNKNIGQTQPSSELPFHQMAYDKNPHIKAIIHAHPIGTVAFSAIRKVPHDHLVYDFHDYHVKASFAKYALPGSKDLAENINIQFMSGSNVVFLENHGIVIGMESLAEAYTILEHIEASCMQEILLNQIDSKASVTSKHTSIDVKEQNFISIHTSVKTDIPLISKRMSVTGLVHGNRAVVSERVDDVQFGITKRNIPLNQVANENVIFSDIENISCVQSQPLLELVQRIYMKDKDFRAVIVAAPLRAMAFSLADQQINTKIIPEGYILLRDVPKIEDFDIDLIVKTLSKDSQIINVSGYFYISIGISLLQAFDRLEVLEFGAESLLYAGQFGHTYSISQEEIDRINQKFTGW